MPRLLPGQHRPIDYGSSAARNRAGAMGYSWPRAR